MGRETAAGSRCYLSSTSLTLPSPFSNTKHSIHFKEISSTNTKEKSKNEMSKIKKKTQKTVKFTQVNADRLFLPDLQIFRGVFDSWHALPDRPSVFVFVSECAADPFRQTCVCVCICGLCQADHLCL